MKMENEITIAYKLPQNWEKQKEFSFSKLADLVSEIHDSAYTASVKAVNRFATVRNYIIGLYIVEYEQHGNDRAKYGERLLKRLEETVHTKGLNETLFKICRQFYLKYPHIRDFLSGKSATPSHQFMTAPETLITNLSFSHIREILTLDEPLERYFYETECIKCCWSVQELRRQISTNLYFRSGVSKKPELLLAQTEKNAIPALSIKDPFTFEFLGLRPEAFTESDLENALIAHLQDFLLELGKGFCFEARQKRMIFDDEYY